MLGLRRGVCGGPEVSETKHDWPSEPRLNTCVDEARRFPNNTWTDNLLEGPSVLQV